LPRTATVPATMRRTASDTAARRGHARSSNARLGALFALHPQPGPEFLAAGHLDAAPLGNGGDMTSVRLSAELGVLLGRSRTSTASFSRPGSARRAPGPEVNAATAGMKRSKTPQAPRGDQDWMGRIKFSPLPGRQHGDTPGGQY